MVLNVILSLDYIKEFAFVNNNITSYNKVNIIM